MAIPFGSIGQLALGNLVSRGADRLLNPDRVSKNQFNLLTGGGYSGSGEDEEKDKGSKTLGGIAKSGIMSLIANALLGPVFGQLALTLGKNFVNKRQQQGLGLNPFGGDGTPGPAGIMSGKVQTLDGRIVDSDSDEARADLDARDQAFQETGDYDEYANSVTTPATATFSYDPNRDYYEGSDEQDKDNESDSSGDDNSGGSGGGNTSSDQGETSSDSGFGGSGQETQDNMYARGGRASYSGGGLASLL
jgi:hypothetical protein